MTATNDFPTINEQEDQLLAAGWQRVTRTIWKSPLPGGKLYLGPHGAWRIAKELGLILNTGERRFLAHASCDLCGDRGATYVKLRGGFRRLCNHCANLVEDAGLAVQPDIVRPASSSSSDWENLRPDGTKHREAKP